MIRSFHRAAAMLAAVFALLPAAAPAVPFEIAALPSRFELSSKSGGRIGQSLKLQNVATTPADVAVRTLDWDYSAQGAIHFHEDLVPGSCRPWVTLERHKLTIAPRAEVAFRFQIDVPADAPRGECRFMLAVESAEPAFTSQISGGAANISLPVSGRIAIAVYVAVNGAEPRLEVIALGTKEAGGRKNPSITVRNVGDAHGRLDGGIDAVDAKGQKVELVPDSSPIMGGQTRTLAMTPRVEPGQKPPDLAYPVKGSGRIDWDNGSFKIDAEFK
jgi:hypothetical protein